MNLVQPSKVNHKVRNELNIQNNMMNVNKLLSEPFEGVSIKDNIRGIVISFRFTIINVANSQQTCIWNLTHDIATLMFYNNFALQINPILA